MEPPPFSKWTPWTDRQSIAGTEHPGVYLLAHFDGPPPASVDPTDPEVVYIGESCRSLRRRWRSFHRAISEGKRGHSGGLTYHAAFCGESPDAFKQRLYAAAMPVTIDEPHRSALIRHIERKLIWEFVQRHGRLPQCNSK